MQDVIPTNKRNLRIPSLGVTILVALMVIAGCGDGGSTDEPTSAGDDSSTAEVSDSSDSSGSSESTTSSETSATAVNGTELAGTELTGTTLKSSVADASAAVASVTEPTSESSQSVTSPTSDSATTCVTVATTIPGQEFCDGYDPTPDVTVNDDCPDWVSKPVSKPSGGWLGSGASVTDGLGRSYTGRIDSHPELDAFANRARSATPAGFTYFTAFAWADLGCVDETLIPRVQFDGPDDSVLGVTRMQLTGQVSWFEEPYAPGNVTTTADGTEVAWYDSKSVIKVWMVSPDGVLVKATAYGANANRMIGFPTTIPTTMSTGPAPPVLPLTITVDDVLALVRAVQS